MFLRRRSHGEHEIVRHRVGIGDAEVAKQCKELSHDQVDHSESNARRNSSHDSNAFEDVDFVIAEGEYSLQDGWAQFVSHCSYR